MKHIEMKKLTSEQLGSLIGNAEQEIQRLLLPDFSDAFVVAMKQTCTFYQLPVVTDPATGHKGISLDSVRRVLPRLNLTCADWCTVHGRINRGDPRFFRLTGFKRLRPEIPTPFLVLDGLKAIILELWPRKGRRAVERFEAEAAGKPIPPAARRRRTVRAIRRH